ncbi:MAG: hypothetical protein H7296_15700 [Bacteroidia bacterium]|nr:hypothetical protein [Bacteroidia bacterium]
MKCWCTYLCLVCFYTGFTQTRAELTKPAYSRCIKINPLSLAIGSISVHYEKIISNEKSINIFANLLNLRYRNNFYGFGLGAGLRSYFTGSDKNSFYVEPFLKYQFLSNAYNIGSINAISIGLTGGRKWTVTHRITFEFFGGPLLSKGFIKQGTMPAYTNAETLGPLNGIWFRGGIAVGYSFN